METITLNAGGSMDLNFKSLATAGYLWKYEMDKTGIVSVTPKNNVNNLPTNQSPDEAFTVLGIRAGTVHLIFRQSRNWQKDDPAAVKEFQVQVQ